MPIDAICRQYYPGHVDCRRQKIVLRLRHHRSLFRSGRSHRYAFVQFASDADARRAMKYDGTAHGSIVLKIKEKQSQLSSTSPNAIFVGNLPLEITAERVKSLFEGYGEIMGIRLIPDKATSKCKGYGFVVYRDSAAVERALKATGTVVDGRTIEVRDARPDSQRESPKHSGAEFTSQADKLLQSLQRSMKQHNGETAKSHKKEDKKITTLYVGGLASTLTPEDLKEYFGQCGPVGDIRWEMDYQTGGRRKFAFVDFETESAAQKAMDLNGNEFHGRYLKIHRAQVKNSVTDPLVIFVGNLPSTITTRRLREFFNQCGDVKDVRLVLDKKTGLPSGFGYVEYFSETSVTSALEFNGYEMDGRRLKVENATMDNKSKRESFSKGRDSRDYGSPEFRDRSRSRSRSPRRDRDRRSRERYNGRDRDRDRDYRRRD
ncbi:hypothetical protein BKA69DRAFT_444633 [Paraphysoderma sedebokerense]|nr:hypothetical protein BKA69DRAFT_444633 [Paraphysoderma sedebokerense]